MIESELIQTKPKPKKKKYDSAKSDEKELMLEKAYFCAFELMDSIKNKPKTKTSETIE